MPGAWSSRRLIAALGLALASPAWAQVSGGGSTGGGGIIIGPGGSSEIEWHTDEHSFSGSANIEPSDLLMAVFGVRDVKDHGGQLEWDAYSVDASLSVTTDCGAIKIDADWEALAGDVNQLGEQLVSNLEKAAKAMPMLIICQVSPSLCAELKNLDFKIDSELGFRWDVCESINNFIDDKAQEGRQDAAARSLRAAADVHSLARSSARQQGRQLAGGLIHRAHRAPVRARTIRLGGCVLNLDAKRLSRGDRNIALTPTEYAVLEWVDWFNNRRLLEPLGYLSPTAFEKAYHQQQTTPAMAAGLN